MRHLLNIISGHLDFVKRLPREVIDVQPCKKPFLCKLIWGTMSFFYPRFQLCGLENIPDSPCVVVGNHAQIHGPLVAELRLPFPRYTWCAAEMLTREDVADYAYRDFWSRKPGYIRWLFWLISRVLPVLATYILSHGNVIPVYHDNRVIKTFRQSLQRLQEGNHLLIFPEKDVPHNGILWEFQDRFIDIAKPYYKRTGEKLAFVPMYLAPELRKIIFGKPIAYDPDIPFDQQREEICRYLMDSITELAVSQPKHRVIPYPNMAKRDYPTNIL